MMGHRYDLPIFWMVRRDSRNNRAPRWVSQCRRGPLITVAKERFEEDGKTFLGPLFWGFLTLFE
jgi:hypothetical protein